MAAPEGLAHLRLLIVEDVQELADKGVLRECLALLHSFYEELLAIAQLLPGRLQQGIA